MSSGTPALCTVKVNGTAKSHNITMRLDATVKVLLERVKIEGTNCTEVFTDPEEKAREEEETLIELGAVAGETLEVTVR